MKEDDIISMAREAGFNPGNYMGGNLQIFKRFAALVAAAEREACNSLWEAQRLTDSQISDHIKAAVAAEREACIKLIESYTIPVGNSAVGEMACELTWDALKVIRDAIRARGEK